MTLTICDHCGQERTDYLEIVRYELLPAPIRDTPAVIDLCLVCRNRLRFLIDDFKIAGLNVILQSALSSFRKSWGEPGKAMAQEMPGGG